MIRWDFLEIKADISPEGWIRDRPIVTRAGIFEYRKADGSVQREFRSEEEVFRADSLASLHGIPITVDHVQGLATKSNITAQVGTVLSPGARESNNVLADVIVHNPDRLGARRELSLAYECGIDDTPGEFQGLRYDAVQKNIKYNHLAVVTRGRAGNARLRLDADDAASQPTEWETDPMPDPKLVSVRLDEIDYQASPEVANALKKAQEAERDLRKRFDGVEAERDTLKSKLEESTKQHDEKVKELRASARADAKARIELEQTAAKLEFKFDAAMSDVDIKRGLVGKLRPALKLDGKSDDYVASAFDAIVDLEADRLTKAAGQRDKIDGARVRTDAGVSSAQSARAAMIAGLQAGSKNQHGAKAGADA